MSPSLKMNFPKQFHSVFKFQHLNSPRHNINYADNMTKSNDGGGMTADAHQINNIPMLNMFLQTLQPPAPKLVPPPGASSARKGRGGWQAAGGVPAKGGQPKRSPQSATEVER